MLLLCCGAAAAEPLPVLEERAIQAAVDRVAPSVLRIETVGGLERVGNVLVGTGPTTGLAVSADGYVISSAFNFAQKPDSILVNLPDGTRHPATLVATDTSRRLVLLKVAGDVKLTPAEAVPLGEIRPGQWAIALGRTFDGGQPNASVGIVSAVNRIWSKAIQTDAKVSPSNYGGPLVDIRGRVLGVLAPLAPDAQADVAGVEWYDSGIGFAVPLAHVLEVLPRLQAGRDLRAGILGISLAPGDQFSQPATVAACRVNSPAYQAGLRKGDKIIEIDGRPIVRQTELKHAVNPHYAGDTLRVVALRGQERLERAVELVDKLPPYEFSFLGILPRREPVETADADGDAGADSAAAKPVPGKTPDGDAPDDHADKPARGEKKLPEAPVVVRYVYPGSPAAQAGLQAGDEIVKAAGQALHGRAELESLLRERGAGEPLPLEVHRAKQTLSLTATLATLPTEVPAELPPAHEPLAEWTSERPQTGVIALKIPEFRNTCSALVPDGYRPDTPHGVVIWLHAPGAAKPDEALAAWKALCAKHELILLAPQAADPARWQPTEAAFVRRALAELAKTYAIDKHRVVVHGQQGGGTLAFLAALASRDVVRGVAVVDAPLPATAQPPETDPLQPLAFYVATAEKSPGTAAIEAGLRKLAEQKFPITRIDQGPQPRALSDDERAGLARWVDALDRL